MCRNSNLYFFCPWKKTSSKVVHIQKYILLYKLKLILLILIHSSFINWTLANQCPNVSTTPLRQWGFRQCLPFSWTTLSGKHFQHPIAVMGVVDTFGPCFINPMLSFHPRHILAIVPLSTTLSGTDIELHTNWTALLYVKHHSTKELADCTYRVYNASI